MITEEYRTHSRLFGGRFFALFPVLILAITAGTFGALTAAGVQAATMTYGAGLVLLFLGLNVGTIGFISRDALKNLLGEYNLVLFSARTLPISWNRIVAIFVLKDIIYYVGLFVLPIAVAGLVVLPPAQVAVAFVAYLLAFSVGVATSFLLAVLYTRSRLLLGAGLGCLVGLLWYFNTGILAFTGLVLLRRPTLANAVFAVVPVLVLAGLGTVLFTPAGRHGRRQRSALLGRLTDRIPGHDVVVGKTVIDMLRSSGGVWKIVFSQGLVFLVFYLAIDRVPFLMTAVRQPGIAFGAIAALSSVTVYNWINRFDDRSGYLMLPIRLDELMASKHEAFMLISYPISVLLVLAASTSLGMFVVGELVMCFTTVYLIGAASYFGGFEPNTRLLDTRVFTAFSLVVLVPMVPLMVLSMWPGSGLWLRIGAVVLSMATVLPGIWMLRRARDRWKND